MGESMTFHQLVLDDVVGRNDDDAKAWLRSDAIVDAFYDDLRVTAADYHARIEIAKSRRRHYHQERRMYAKLSVRLCEVKPIVVALHNRQAQERSRSDAWRFWKAIEKHRNAHVDANIEPTEHDMELWSALGESMHSTSESPK